MHLRAMLCDIDLPLELQSALASVRTDELAALPIRALMERNPKVDWAQTDGK